MKEFDFTHAPLPPLVLNTRIPGNLTMHCRLAGNDVTSTCQKTKVSLSWSKILGQDANNPSTYHIARDGVDVPACPTVAPKCADTPPPGVHF